MSVCMCTCMHVCGRKERNVLFNNALNTFYLQLFSIRHMVKDHSEIREILMVSLHGQLIHLAARDLLYIMDSAYHCI